MQFRRRKLTIGDRGADVAAAQRQLNRRGAHLREDGVFGPATRAAVQDYKERAGLGADGALDAETRRRLAAPAATAEKGPLPDGEISPVRPVTETMTASRATASRAAGYGGPYGARSMPGETAASRAAGYVGPYGARSAPGETAAETAAARPTAQTAAVPRAAAADGGYRPSAAVEEAYAAYETARENAPGEYESPYAQELEELYALIDGRQPFTYDAESDPLYRQYRQQYVRLGQRAMEDAQGSAAALTGGYGSTWAQGAGQQAYDEYLQRLGDVLPELYEGAWARYKAEGDALYDRYGLLRGAESDAYGRYRDAVSDYRSRLQDAWGRYQSERSFDYGAYTDAQEAAAKAAQAEREEAWRQLQQAYKEERDRISDAHWAALHGSYGSSSGGSYAGGEEGTQRVSSRAAFTAPAGEGKRKADITPAPAPEAREKQRAYGPGISREAQVASGRGIHGTGERSEWDYLLGNVERLASGGAGADAVGRYVRSFQGRMDEAQWNELRRLLSRWDMDSLLA